MSSGDIREDKIQRTDTVVSREYYRRLDKSTLIFRSSHTSQSGYTADSRWNIDSSHTMSAWVVSLGHIKQKSQNIVMSQLCDADTLWPNIIFLLKMPRCHDEHWLVLPSYNSGKKFATFMSLVCLESSCLLSLLWFEDMHCVCAVLF